MLGKHWASEDAYVIRFACLQLTLEFVWDPKSFLSELIPCGPTYSWCAPVVAVLNTTGSHMYFISRSLERARLGHHAEWTKLT